MRGTTRDAGGRAAIEATGAEAFLADPSRVGSVAPALEGVGVLCALLGSASGSRQDLAALHGSRLEMLLLRLIDTPVRGFAYEVAGTVQREVLRDGARIVRVACTRSMIPYALLEAQPRDHQRWLDAAAAAVDGLLAGRSVDAAKDATAAERSGPLR